MKSYLKIEKIWEDDDVIEVVLTMSDGRSFFSTEIYVGFGTLTETIEDLDKFKHQRHGGICTLKWGSFGPKYANGAARISLRSHNNNLLFIFGEIESSYTDVLGSDIASKAELYFQTPLFLDGFIENLPSLTHERLGTASLGDNE